MLIYADNRRFQTKEQLQDAISQGWIGIGQKLINNFVLSIENRIFQVIQRKGGPTDY
jgi:hypothetical protein